MSRRSVFNAAVMFAGSLALRHPVPLGAAYLISFSPKSVDLASCVLRRVQHLFRDLSAANAIGELYLADHPEEADVFCLLRLLTHDPKAGTSSSLGASGVDTWLAERIAQDLRDGEVVLVAGWVLARSEARLCVLADPSRTSA